MTAFVIFPTLCEGGTCCCPHQVYSLKILSTPGQQTQVTFSILKLYLRYLLQDPHTPLACRHVLHTTPPVALPCFQCPRARPSSGKAACNKFSSTSHIQKLKADCSQYCGGKHCANKNLAYRSAFIMRTPGNLSAHPIG